jgi:hypothetical protein
MTMLIVTSFLFLNGFAVSASLLSETKVLFGQVDVSDACDTNFGQVLYGQSSFVVETESENKEKVSLEISVMRDDQTLAASVPMRGVNKLVYPLNSKSWGQDSRGEFQLLTIMINASDAESGAKQSQHCRYKVFRKASL